MILCPEPPSARKNVETPDPGLTSWATFTPSLSGLHSEAGFIRRHLSTVGSRSTLIVLAMVWGSGHCPKACPKKIPDFQTESDQARWWAENQDRLAEEFERTAAAGVSAAEQSPQEDAPRGPKYQMYLKIAYAWEPLPSAGGCSDIALSISSRRFARASARFWRFSSSSCSEPSSSMKAFSAPSPFWKPVRTMRR